MPMRGEDITLPSPLLLEHFSSHKPSIYLGHNSNGSFHTSYLRVLDHAEEMGFATLLPDGTLNSAGARFWNAPRCCNTEELDIDDVGYLKAILTVRQRCY